MIETLRRVYAFLGARGVTALAVGMLLLLPFDLAAVTRLTGWEWWAALAVLLFISLVPLAGQLIYACLAVVGAFYLGQEYLVPQPVVAVGVPSSSIAASSATDKFAEWKRTVGGPAIQEECLSKAQRHGLIEGRQIEQMARVCACYGAAAITVLEKSDVVDDAVRASPELEARMSDEARRLCKG